MLDCTLWQQVTELSRSTFKILFSAPIFRQAHKQPPVDSRVVKDQQRQCCTPMRVAMMGSRQDLHWEIRIVVPHLPDLTQKQAAD